MRKKTTKKKTVQATMTETLKLPQSSIKPKLTLKVTEEPSFHAGFLFMDKMAVQRIRDNSGKLATNNEYQVHWEGINYRLTRDNQFLDITIPTVFYNYKQEVSSSTINFDLKDVKSTIETLNSFIKLENDKANKTFIKQVVDFAEEYGFVVSLFNVSMSNIHRHPGGLDRFSGTDYDKDPNNPGIVYPLASGKDMPIYSSIILHDKDLAYLAHTEYRVANSIDKANLVYKRGHCVVYNKGYHITYPSLFSALSGIEGITEPTTIYVDGEIDKSSEIASKIISIFESTEYSPNTQFILSSNLSKPKPVNTSLYSYEDDIIDTFNDFSYRNYLDYRALSSEDDLGTFVANEQFPGELPTAQQIIDNEDNYYDFIFKTKYGEIYSNDMISLIMDTYLGLIEKPLKIDPLETVEDIYKKLPKKLKEEYFSQVV